MKQSTRLIAAAALVLALAAAPAGAETKTLAQVDLCVSRVDFDDFTDELSHVAIWCFGDDSDKSVVLGVNPEEPYLIFFDQGRKWRVPEDGAEVELVYRFDDLPAVTIKASWVAQHERAETPVSLDEAEAILDGLLTADRLIYRIGGRAANILSIDLTGDRMPLWEAAAEYVAELVKDDQEGL